VPPSSSSSYPHIAIMRRRHKQGRSRWKCEVCSCHIDPGGSSKKCIACETRKAGGSSGFLFGDHGGDGTIISTSGFYFGAPAPTPSKQADTPATGGGFSFGSSSGTGRGLSFGPADAGGSGFSFGAPASFSKIEDPTTTDKPPAPGSGGVSFASYPPMSSKAPTPFGAAQSKPPTIPSSSYPPMPSRASTPLFGAAQSKPSTTPSSSSPPKGARKAPTSFGFLFQSKPSTTPSSSSPPKARKAPTSFDGFSQSKPSTTPSSSSPPKARKAPTSFGFLFQSKPSTTPSSSSPPKARKAPMPFGLSQSKPSTTPSSSFPPLMATKAPSPSFGAAQSKPWTTPSPSSPHIATTKAPSPSFGAAQSKPWTTPSPSSPLMATKAPTPSFGAAQSKPWTTPSPSSPLMATKAPTPSFGAAQSKPWTIPSPSSPLMATKAPTPSFGAAQSKPWTIPSPSSPYIATKAPTPFGVGPQPKPSSGGCPPLASTKLEKTEPRIKVALFGHAGVGKTTLLKALLRDKFNSKVSMPSIPEGVNLFRVSWPSSCSPNSNMSKSDSDDNEGKRSRMNQSESMLWSELKKSPHNVELHKTEVFLQERIFDIELEESICELPKDAKLTIVDIPGLSQILSTSTKEVCTKYVSDNWDTFDCVLVVLDTEKGVDTQEDAEILELVKDHFEKKTVPVIVLCNKVDEPHDPDTIRLVQDMRDQVEKIFNIPDRKRTLDQILTGSNEERSQLSDVYPIVIPMSAENAFAYQTVARLSLDELKDFDGKLINKLGRDEVGNFKWKKLSLEAKCEAVHATICDEEHFQERFEATNFDSFLSVLSFCLNDNTVRTDKQLEALFREISFGSPIPSDLHSICQEQRIPIESKFWAAYDKSFEDAMLAFENDMDISGLSKVMDDLMRYSSLATQLGWTDESVMICKRMEELLRRQLQVTLVNANKWTGNGCYLSKMRDGDVPACPSNWERIKPDAWKNMETGEIGDHPVLGKLSWESLNPNEWATLLGSLSLVWCDRHFLFRFGREKIMLERHLKAFDYYFYADKKGIQLKHHDRTTAVQRSGYLNAVSESMRIEYSGGDSLSYDVDNYLAMTRIITPELLSDPRHWGGTFWRYCEFKRKTERSNF
jgi:GTPase SAR1 family protein